MSANGETLNPDVRFPCSCLDPKTSADKSCSPFTIYTVLHVGAFVLIYTSKNYKLEVCHVLNAVSRIMKYRIRNSVHVK